MLRYLILENLTCPTRVTHKIPTTIFGKKNLLTISLFIDYSLLCKKDGILGNITRYRKKRKKERKRGRKKELIRLETYRTNSKI